MTEQKSMFSARTVQEDRLIPLDKILEKPFEPDKSEEEETALERLDEEEEIKNLKKVSQKELKDLNKKQADRIENLVYNQMILPEFDRIEFNETVYQLFFNARNEDKGLKHESEEVIRYSKFFNYIEKALIKQDYRLVQRVLKDFPLGNVVREYLKDYEEELSNRQWNLTRLYLEYDMEEEFYSLASTFLIKSVIFLEALQRVYLNKISKETMYWRIQGSRSRIGRISQKAKRLVEPSKKINFLYNIMHQGLRSIYLYIVNAELFNISSLDEIEYGDGKLCFSKVPEENKKNIIKELSRCLLILNEVISKDDKSTKEYIKSCFHLTTDENIFVFFGKGIIDDLQDIQRKSMVELLNTS